MRSAADKIASWLNRYPGGHLYIATGYASVPGLAWLSRHAAGRPVDVLVGDCRQRFFAEFSKANGMAASAFLSRHDVRIMRHARRTERFAHAKIWMLEDSTGNYKILAGSANLTNGMMNNIECMGEYTGDDKTEARQQMRAMFAQAWDATHIVRGYIENEISPPAPIYAPVPISPPPVSEPRTSAGKRKRKKLKWRII